jgi:polysaccharide biosynthesis protein PslA
LVAIAAATKTTQQYSRLWFFSWALTATEMVLFARLCALTWMNGRLQRGACIYRALSLRLGAPALNAEDIMVSSLVLVLVSPLLLITAIAIKLESGGPVFFRQMREGLNGTHFELLKFRSMFVEQADPHGTRQTSRDDSRVTAIGRIIRKLSIDELPQLFNVLQGSMSLVGPRPHPLRMSAEGKALDQVVDYYASRHRVKSGITGGAQINGLRGEANSIEKIKARVDHDLYYIQNWSIWLDLKIMARTAALLIFDRKAY